MTVSFAGQAPTGQGVPVSFVAPDGTSITSPDPAGGGNDFDGELTFTATPDALAVLGAPAHNGYHVRLTADTGQGGGHKYKVFWISACAPATPSTSASTPTPALTPQLSVDTPTVRSDSIIGSRPSVTTPQLDTAEATRTTARLQEASPPVTSLPFTGADLGWLILSGIVAFVGGVVLTVLSRLRRRMG
ncbi:MAG TPA: hypothetical protein VHC43_03215 [Mycobacteriales bacterium]|nr:hypothetical protein [Mycobacteriales bacterium]